MKIAIFHEIFENLINLLDQLPENAPLMYEIGKVLVLFHPIFERFLRFLKGVDSSLYSNPHLFDSEEYETLVKMFGVFVHTWFYFVEFSKFVWCALTC